MKFTDIKVLIWDFDGTFYPPNKELWEEMHQAEFKVIQNHTGWDINKTEAEFEKVHKVTIPSAYMTVAKLSGISVADAAVEIENNFDRKKYINYDEKLVAMFRILKDYVHYILGNGSKIKISGALSVLGVGSDLFQEIVTSEITGVNKPEPNGFRYILKKTNYPASGHLMIGDRINSDLIPAKKLGMITCHVGPEEKSEFADINIPVVYDIVKYLH